MATPKSKADFSNTYLLSEFLAKQLGNFDAECEIVRLGNYNIKDGTYTHIDSDDWLIVYEMYLNIETLTTPYLRRDPG